MTRAGITLLELLIALALLSGLTLASIAWTTSSVRTSHALDGRARWETAASTALELIAEDLRAGDISRRRYDRDGLPDWISTEGGLSTRVRAAPYTGSERASYKLEPASGVLCRTLQTQETWPERSRTLLGDVASFDCALRPLGQPGASPVELAAELSSRRGWVVARRFLIELEPTP